MEEYPFGVSKMSLDSKSANPEVNTRCKAALRTALPRMNPQEIGRHERRFAMVHAAWYIIGIARKGDLLWGGVGGWYYHCWLLQSVC